MIGRSVASVRSPVRNLSEVKSGITHDDFCEAIIEAFVEQYGVQNKVVRIGEEDLEGQEYSVERNFVEKSMAELEVRIILTNFRQCRLWLHQSWEWKYGQTLEFSYTVSGKIDETSVVSLWNTRLCDCVHVRCSALTSKRSMASLRNAIFTLYDIPMMLTNL